MSTVDDILNNSVTQVPEQDAEEAKLWEDVLKMRISVNDEIEEDFLFFPAGTSKFEVWHWFDERCPRNLHDDLLNPSNN